MMKRLLCLALTLVVFLSLAIPVSATETEEPETLMTMSEEGVDMIKSFEGFSKKPYWDVSQWTVGYGTSCPSDKLEEYKANGITKEEAEELLRDRLKSYEKAVRYFSSENDRPLSQQEFDALVCFTYNLGSGWVYKEDSNFHKTMANADSSDAQVIFWFGAYSSASGKVLTGLVRRRMAEANLFLNGVYETSRPANYCYVKLDATGGEQDSRVNAYDINTDERVELIPTREGYSFLGWYTEEEGGTRVTNLTESHNGETLYAHWGDGSEDDDTGDETEPEEPFDPVKVTVTSNDVNLRKGPGTNYTRVGSVDKGDELTITAVKQNGSRLWGKSNLGWLSLQYTNYDDVINGTVKPEEPEQPEQPTDPETPEEPEQPKVMGTVDVSNSLSIRKGPGTGYARVGYLYDGDRVEILTQKVVGSTTWGQIDRGWISLQYVDLDEEPSQPEQPAEPEQPVEPEEPEQPTDPETPEEPEQPKVMGTVDVSNSLSIRKGPGTGYARVGYLYDGDRVEILNQKVVGSTTWGQIDRGWISLQYVDLDEEPSQPEQPAEPEQPVEPEEPEQPTDPETPEEPEQPKVMGTVDVSNSLSIRKGPGTGYARVGYLYDGDRVEILNQKVVGSTTWGQIDRGWISLQYVDLDEELSQPEQPAEPEQPVEPEEPEQPEKPVEPEQPETTAVTGTVKVGTSLLIRKGPGTSYGIAGSLRNGTKVTITQQEVVGSTTWGNMGKGWISMNYVVLDEQQTEKPSEPSNPTEPETPVLPETDEEKKNMGTVEVDSSLSIRSGPGTSYSVKGYYRSGDRVEILDVQKVGSVTWGKTEKGWVSLQYVKLDEPAQQKDMRKITATSLNVRKGAGTNFGIVDYLYKGEIVEILETTIVNNVEWGRVATGWISLEYTE